ncbi:MAG TPA: gluconate 2-dehydrogenase subunit 3 family protein [Steroidobacteraceae bacterium]
MSNFRRRDLLAGTALVLIGRAARAGLIAGHLPWAPAAEPVPASAPPGSWLFFTPAEAAMVETLADRIIPPDPQTPGGKAAGCTEFIDRQLSGPYGRHEGLYNRPPFTKGSKQQGPQSAKGPAELYRSTLAALDRYCRAQPGGKSWLELGADRQDEILRGLEASTLELEGADGKTFFEELLKDVQQGFFADPIYGGNRDMCAWKMIGFPGAHYDYRDWVGRHNERYPNPPVSIAGRPGWTPT